MSTVEITVMTIVAIWLVLAVALVDMQARREEKSFTRTTPGGRRAFAALAARRRIKGRVRTF